MVSAFNAVQLLSYIDNTEFEIIYRKELLPSNVLSQTRNHSRHKGAIFQKLHHNILLP